VCPFVLCLSLSLSPSPPLASRPLSDNGDFGLEDQRNGLSRVKVEEEATHWTQAKQASR
jgi:hypothetical protein